MKTNKYKCIKTEYKIDCSQQRRKIILKKNIMMIHGLKVI
jgi:hypothetical protein